MNNLSNGKIYNNIRHGSYEGTSVQYYNNHNWYKKYNEGIELSSKGNINEAVLCFLEAYQIDPCRLEPFYHIAKEYRKCGKNNLTYLFANLILNAPTSCFPVEQISKTPLLQNNVNNYDIVSELSIASYYTEHRNKGLYFSDKLIFDRSVPSDIKSMVHNNLIHYVIKLSSDKIRVPINLPFIGDTDKKWRPLNPSIIKSNSIGQPSLLHGREGYIINCRTVNYDQIGHNYISLDSDNIIRTKNFLLTLDKNFNLISQNEITDSIERVQYLGSVQGLEDCRFVKVNNVSTSIQGESLDDYWFTAVTFDNFSYWIPQISMCHLSKSPQLCNDGEQLPIDHIIRMQGPDPKRCEKNWLPFVYNNKIYIIYSFEPFIIFEADPYQGHCNKVIEYKSSFDLSKFRGSAPPINFNDGYLAIVHEVIFMESRIYLHRFVFMDTNFNVEKISPCFYFDHKGIEFCTGLSYSHDNNLLITAGIKDCEAYIFKVDIDYVNSLLISLSDLITSNK